MNGQIADIFNLISHGVYVVGVADGERRNAFTAAWVMQVSFQPPLLAISINPKHYSYDILQAGKVCSVSVLAEGQFELAAHFGRSGTDKLAVYPWHIAQTGAPILSASLGYFDCRLSHLTEAGDHHIAICEVIAAGKLNVGYPLLYAHTGDMDGSQALR